MKMRNDYTTTRDSIKRVITPMSRCCVNEVVHSKNSREER
jgi:hypothetical protein